MRTACGVATPCCSRVVGFAAPRAGGRRRRVAVGAVGVRGVNGDGWRRSAVAVASMERRSDEAWPVKASAVVLAGAALLVEEGSARAESLPDILVDAAGGNVNFVITALCVAEAVALIGAIVGGVIARKRRDELYNINNQLRQINLSLRKQARVESYAPSLTYAPTKGRGGVAVAEPVDQNRENLMSLLKSGKRMLREQSPAEAFVQFEKALELARKLNDAVEEKKAARGLGAACQRQRKYKEAIKYHQLVLAISEKTKEHSGNTEAYGAIGDCYSEIGEMESAAKYYDKYIERLEYV